MGKNCIMGKKPWMLIKREEANKQKRGKVMKAGGVGRGVPLLIGQRKKAKINKGEVFERVINRKSDKRRVK